ncbi:MAG: GDP-mannose 4,6-dehydratase [Alphaproteobacteria bacterium]
MSRTRALITGVTGQDGAYLAALLLAKGYDVVGSARPGSSEWRLRELGIEARISRVTIDLLDTESVEARLRSVRPREIYNLAAQSTIGDSLKEPLRAGELNALAVTRLLEAVRAVDPTIRFFQASSAQIFGEGTSGLCTEETPVRPRSPYAIAKLYAQLTVANYREAYGLHACSGILFNHESSLRGPEFVTRKLTHGLAALAAGGGEPVRLGNVHARRDWGHARDYVRAMWLMLQRQSADDFILATGEAHTVKEFADAAATGAGVDLEWDSADRRAFDRRTGTVIVEVDQALLRPSEGPGLIGDASKAARDLGWRPETDFSALVDEMVSADLARAKEAPPSSGIG